MTPGAPHYFAYAKNATKRFAYPQRVQRLVINDYAARRGLTVTLFFAELPVPGVFYNLEHLLLMRPPARGLVAFSLEQVFPFHAAEGVLRKALACGYEIHFALEEVTVRSEADFEPIRFLEAVKRISDANEQQMDLLMELCDSVPRMPA